MTYWTIGVMGKSKKNKFLNSNRSVFFILKKDLFFVKYKSGPSFEIKTINIYIINESGIRLKTKGIALNVNKRLIPAGRKIEAISIYIHSITNTETTLLKYDSKFIFCKAPSKDIYAYLKFYTFKCKSICCLHTIHNKTCSFYLCSRKRYEFYAKKIFVFIRVISRNLFQHFLPSYKVLL